MQLDLAVERVIMLITSSRPLMRELMESMATVQNDAYDASTAMLCYEQMCDQEHQGIYAWAIE